MAVELERLEIWSVCLTVNDSHQTTFDVTLKAKWAVLVANAPQVDGLAGDALIGVNDQNVVGKKIQEINRLLVTLDKPGTVITFTLIRQKSLNHPALVFLTKVRTYPNEFAKMSSQLFTHQQLT